MINDLIHTDPVDLQSAELHRRTTRVAMAAADQSAAALAIRYRRIVAGWWRYSRTLMPDPRIPRALATSAAKISTCSDQHPWSDITVAAHTLLDAAPDHLEQATTDLLAAIGVDRGTTSWIEAAKDWDLLEVEVIGMDDQSVAELMYRLARFTLAVIADGDTPVHQRPVLVEAALTAIAAVADTRACAGDHQWAGWSHAGVVLAGQDPVARCAALGLAADELTELASGWE
jgi:uncharacterized protein YciU (UPF0263 family)